MLYCYHCNHAFFDGELLTFRVTYSQELPYHGECFENWIAEQSKVAADFGHDFRNAIVDGVETFERYYFDHQFGSQSQ